MVQAKKEELWELSKREGELADATADVHYTEHVARAPPPRSLPYLFAPQQLQMAGHSYCCDHCPSVQSRQSCDRSWKDACCYS